MAFDEKKYRKDYNRKNYGAFKVDLKKDELEELEKELKEKNMTKASFLRKAIEKLKKGDIK